MMRIIQSMLRRLALCGTAFALLWLSACTPAPFAGLEIYILDVGQGDAAFVRTGDACMMIDAGPNASEEMLCAALDAMDVETIDVVIFTHPDEDHIGGGDLLLERFAVDAVYLAPITSDETSFAGLLTSAAASGADIRIGTAGVSFSLGEAVVSFLAPAAAYEETNRASIVVRVEYDETAALFMGDADYDAEAAILAGDTAMHADLIKIGHHGANTSTSEALLDAVEPAFAAISCGYANQYGHPIRRVIDALESRNIAIARTDRDGMLLYRSDGKRLWQEKR